MRYLLLFLFLPPMLLGGAGLRFTLRKLDKMKQIRGFEPAEDLRKVPVLEKVCDRRSCWIRWSETASIKKPGAHRFDIPLDASDRYAVGAQVEVLFFAGEGEPYPRETIFADDGNFALDRVILAIEATMIAGSLLLAAGAARLLRRWGRASSA